MIDTANRRIPLGSLMVDTSLVIALLWGGARMTEQLTQLTHRVDAIEATTVRQNTDARVLVLERRADETTEFKRDLSERLSRIEDKLDQLAERRK